MLFENEVVSRLLDDERRIAIQGIQQLVCELALSAPAEMAGRIGANGCDHRINDGCQPAQACDQLVRVVTVRLTDDVMSPHVQELLASFHEY